MSRNTFLVKLDKNSLHLNVFDKIYLQKSQFFEITLNYLLIAF